MMQFWITSDSQLTEKKQNQTEKQNKNTQKQKQVDKCSRIEFSSSSLWILERIGT